MTNKKKLISAVAMLLIAAVAVTSASYAWFSMNKEVTASGLTMTATAPTSLTISVNNIDFNPTATVTTSTNPFTPVSGDFATTAFFYALKMDTDGPLAEITTQEFTTIPGAADTSRQYYVDIPLYIKSVELETGTNVDLYIRSLIITSVEDSDLANAFKVAVLNGGTVKGVYANDGTGTWKPIEYDGVEEEYVISETAVTPTTQGVGGTIVGTVTAPDTAVTLVLRVWLEGQDTDCSYLLADGAYGISIEIEGLDILA